MRPESRIWLFPISLGGGSIDISNKISSWMTDSSIHGRTGGFSIEVPNTNGNEIGSILYGDRIKLQVYDDSAADFQTIFFGVVEQEQETLGRVNVLSYKGIDYARKLMDFFVTQAFHSGTDIGDLWQLDSDGAGSTLKSFNGGSINSAIVVQKMIDSFYELSDLTFDQLDYVTYIDRDARLGLESGVKGWAEVDVFREVGSAFFKGFNNKRINEAIIEVTSDEWTGNGDYIFFVDENKAVHFEKKKSTIHDRIITEGVDILSLNVNRGISNKFTVILVNAGDDWSGNAVYCAGWNEAGIRQAGYKWGYVDKKGIFIEAARTLSGQINPVTSVAFTWDEIKTAAKILGVDTAMKIAKDQGLPKWEANIRLNGTLDFTIGSAFIVEVESNRWEDHKARLKSVKHQFGQNGWITTIGLEEDVGEVR